jgi:hypothetical protein
MSLGLADIARAILGMPGFSLPGGVELIAARRAGTR